AGSGALALAVRGPTRAPSGPVLPRAPAIRDPGTLALVGIAFVAALAVVLISLQPHTRIPGWLLILVAVLLIVAGMVAAWKPAPTDSPGGAEKPAEEKAGRVGPAWRAAALVVTLGLIAVRGYAGAIRLDWPFLRGTDQFSYVIMSEQLMKHGSYGTFLIYPP